jgi:hypothetical protein
MLRVWKEGRNFIILSYDNIAAPAVSPSKNYFGVVTKMLKKVDVYSFETI